MLLTPKELCARWQISDDTLRRWRCRGEGPNYIKLGDGRNAEVRYRLDDVEAFEKHNRYTTRQS